MAAGTKKAKKTTASIAPVGNTMAPFQSPLLEHYDAHKRAMPWRDSRDPYAIWVSEVMLQQTRVETVLRYYSAFLERFPTVRALAEADEPAVMQRWSGLGYYRRARLLHAGAKAVVERHNGAIPRDPEALRALPGVGRYTAGAIASIAFGLKEPVVDGNVERVLTRWFALPGDPTKTPVRDSLWKLAAKLADHARPGDVNQAMMELGATVCTPTSPRCLVCPVRALCVASARGQAEMFPQNKAAKAPRKEEWVALVVRAPDDHVLLGTGVGDRFRGMRVPLMAGRGTGDDPIAVAGEIAKSAGVRLVGKAGSAGEVVHVLTHAAMHVTVVTARTSDRDERSVPVRTLPEAALPTLAWKILERAGIGKATGGTTGGKNAQRDSSV